MSIQKPILRAIELRRFSKNRTKIDLPAGRMSVRFGVYFNESVNTQHGNTLLKHEPEKSAIRLWLRRNVAGKYSTQASYVFFEDESDAMLCYLAFRG